MLAAHQKRTDELLRSLLRVAALGELEAAGMDASGQVAGAPPDAAVERRVQAGLPARAEALLPSLVEALRGMSGLDSAVSQASSLSILANLADIRDWRTAFGTPAAIAGMSPQALQRLPQWVRAARARVDSLVDAPSRDTQLLDRVRGSESAVLAKLTKREPAVADLGRAERLGAVGEEWHAVLLASEELRVGLFAPSVGTAGKVSEQRIAKALAKL